VQHQILLEQQHEPRSLPRRSGIRPGQPAAPVSRGHALLRGGAGPWTGERRFQTSEGRAGSHVRG
jgi:hypothetical protein